MAYVCGFGDPGPVASAVLQQGSDLGFTDGVFIGHARSLVKHSCAVKEQITKWMGHSLGVPEKESISRIVASNLDQLMKQSKMTQPALAAKAGVSQKTISNYLNPEQRVSSASGKTPSPKLEELSKIADALNVPLWRIVRKWNAREMRFYERMERLWLEMTEEEKTKG